MKRHITLIILILTSINMFGQRHFDSIVKVLFNEYHDTVIVFKKIYFLNSLRNTTFEKTFLDGKTLTVSTIKTSIENFNNEKTQYYVDSLSKFNYYLGETISNKVIHNSNVSNVKLKKSDKRGKLYTFEINDIRTLNGDTIFKMTHIDQRERWYSEKKEAILGTYFEPMTVIWKSKNNLQYCFFEFDASNVDKDENEYLVAKYITAIKKK